MLATTMATLLLQANAYPARGWGYGGGWWGFWWIWLIIIAFIILFGFGFSGGYYRGGPRRWGRRRTDHPDEPGPV